MPKGVITPHRMLLENQAAFADVHPYVRAHPPVLVDWLPWNHCHAGNYTLGIAIYNGGTYRFATGRPIGDEFAPVLDAMAAEPPTVHLDVPQGYEAITARLETDPAFRDRFFSRLDLLFYAGSSMPETLWRRIEAASRASLGKTIVITTGYGSTETGPLHLLATAPAPGPRHIGTPVPGAEALLIPDEGRYEIRVRGGNVTPGYFRDPKRTAEAFDAEGFFITGDAVTMVDAQHPERGLHFEGRVGLNFKLTSGTWVRVDTVRVAVLEALGPLARDAIIAGHERSHIGILIFPNPEGMRARLGPRAAGLDTSALLALPETRDAIAAALARYNKAHPGSSRQVARAFLLDEPPALYDRDLTDKRYLNQRAALKRRQELADRLFADPPPPATIFPAAA